MIKRHKEQNDWGNSGNKHFLKVLQLIERYNITSLLDFGCGKGAFGNQYREAQEPEVFTDEQGNDQTVESDLAKIPLYEYDPAIEGKQKTLRKAHSVICTDVLNHVEKDQLDRVIKNIVRNMELRGGIAYITIPCREDPTYQIQLVFTDWVNILNQYFHSVNYDYIEATQELYLVCKNPRR